MANNTSKNLLFRFRDTNGFDTIAEHQEIIGRLGYAWWGWWKKESEPDRLDLLKAITRDLKDFHYFLFDRSSNRFYRIDVGEFYFTGLEKVSSPEREKTPDYYNTVKLRLWIKIRRIESISEQTFLTNFRLIPSFDFTFFTYEDFLKEEDARRSQNDRIKVNSNYILHLSDIHFGEDFGFPSASSPGKRALLDVFKDFIKNDLKHQIGLVIVSGDISSRGVGDHLINQGLTFLEELCRLLNISKDCVLIIPGNHDIPLKDANFQDYNHETLYRIFLEKFYGDKKELFGLDFFQLPCGVKLDVLRIHSVKLRKKEDNNYGYVDWYLYKNLLSGYNLDGDLKLAIIHHHLISMQSEEILNPVYPYGSISVTLDSGRVIEGLQKHDFDFVLNGHQHIPGISKIARGMVNDSNTIDIKERRELTILSAGSAGVKDERFSNEMRYNSFSLYEITPRSIKIEVKYFNPSLEPRRYYNSEVSF